MKVSIFRQKSLDRISSPEQLNDYIRVANPGVWLLLGGIAALLAGVCVWGIFGRLDTVVRAVAVSGNGSVVCYVGEESADRLQTGMTFTLGGAEYTVSGISSQPAAAASVLSDYALHVGEFQPGDWVYSIAVEENTSGETAADGVYEAEIVVDSVSPMNFVLN